MAEYRYDSSKGEVAPIIIDGPPPVDLSGEVARLNLALVAATAERDALLAKIANAKAALA